MIVDASVALKWRFREPDSALAERLLSRPDLAAPSILSIEIRYVIAKLVRQRSISQAEARGPWLSALEGRLVLADSDPLLEDAFEYALILNANFYDCVYLAMAIDEDDVLVTTDEHFVNAVRRSQRLKDRVVRLSETE